MSIYCESAFERMRSERDALKAENERLLDHVQSMIDQTEPLIPVPGDPMWSRRIKIDELMAENESLRKDAERYRWLRNAKGLSLRSDGSKWTRSNGEQFICSHHLCAFDTSYAPFESLDEVIDAAISSPENPS